MLHRDYIGTISPYSLLSNSKSRIRFARMLPVDAIKHTQRLLAPDDLAWGRTLGLLAGF